jgi:hypothetical protein
MTPEELKYNKDLLLLIRDMLDLIKYVSHQEDYTLSRDYRILISLEDRLKLQ